MQKLNQVVERPIFRTALSNGRSLPRTSGISEGLETKTSSSVCLSTLLDQLCSERASFLLRVSVSLQVFTMKYKSEWYRGRAPSPVDSTHILIRKTVTKEKTSNWDWGRASQASSVSSISEAPRSASPLKVAFFRSSSRPRSRSRHHRSSSHTRHHTYHNHYHDDDQDDFHFRAHRQSADEHRHHRRHSRRYSESAPRVEEKGIVHTQKSSQRRHKHSLPAASHQLCPPPILLAVPIRPSRKMEETGGFTYEEWCKRRECVAVPTETIAPKSSISNRSNNTRHSEVSDQENAYHYVPMREPGPQDAVVSFWTKDLWRKND